MRRYLFFPLLAALVLLPFLVARAQPQSKEAGDKPDLPSAADMERLARDKPIEFLEACLRHYDRTVKGYTLVMQKQERIGGKLQRTELLDVAFRNQPHSVLLRWVEGARLAAASLYVEGENDGKMLVRPAGLLLGGLIVERDPESEQAKQSGRYTMREFGLKKGMERTLKSWKAARDKDELHVEYLGERKVKEAGDRPCFALHRDRYARPENDGVLELTVYIDKETYLQVGSTVKGEDGKLIGEYFFRDIHLNPDFKADQFTREALK
jgi:hypothetical protein